MNKYSNKYYVSSIAINQIIIIIYIFIKYKL